MKLKPATSPDMRITAALLTLALLLCHGVFGSMHLSHDPLAASPEVESGANANAAHAGHANHHGGHETIVENDEGGSAAHHSGMAPEYFAVFLALLFGAVFLALRPKISIFAREVASHSSILLRTKFFRPPARGPTLPHLQVFRL